MKYEREKHLKSKLNAYLSQQFNLPTKDYYACLDAKGIIELKLVLSDINNILTLKVTLAFADWLVQQYNLDKEAEATLKSIILDSKPNTNGYDIWLGYPTAFVGEVKCNIPINKGFKYGSQQRIGIEKDIKGLLNGKRKAFITPKQCPKFLAFLDLPEIRKANEHLLKVSSICRENLVFVANGDDISRLDIVHGVYVTANA